MGIVSCAKERIVFLKALRFTGVLLIVLGCFCFFFSLIALFLSFAHNEQTVLVMASFSEATSHPLIAMINQVMTLSINHPWHVALAGLVLVLLGILPYSKATAIKEANKPSPYAPPPRRATVAAPIIQGDPTPKPISKEAVALAPQKEPFVKPVYPPIVPPTAFTPNEPSTPADFSAYQPPTPPPTPPVVDKPTLLTHDEPEISDELDPHFVLDPSIQQPKPRPLSNVDVPTRTITRHIPSPPDATAVKNSDRPVIKISIKKQ